LGQGIKIRTILERNRTGIIMNTWITADTHYLHANVIMYCNRPWQQPSDFYIDAAGRQRWVSYDIAHKRELEMTDALIDNHNARVKKNDLVYHVGDFMFGRTDAEFDAVFKRLNGTIVLIKGNHDKLASRNRHKFFNYHHSGLHETTIEGQSVVLCHYAMKTWNRAHHGSWHLYGHSHGTLPEDPNSLSFDIGVDCHDYMPLSWEQIKTKMAKKTFNPIDHHGKE